MSNTIRAQQQHADIKACLAQIDTTKADSSRIQLLLKLGDLYKDGPLQNAPAAVGTYQQALSLGIKANLITGKNQALLHLAVEYGILKNFKKCRDTYMQVINYWYNRQDWSQVIKTSEFLRYNFHYTPNKNVEMLNEFIWCAQQEQAVYLKQGNTVKAILSLKEEADANLNMGKLTLAENQLLNVARRLKAINYPNLYDTYYLLSAAYYLKGNLNQELYYCIETVKGSLASRDTSTLGMFYYKLARVYEDLSMWDKSIVVYKKIISGQNFKDAHNQYIVLYHICEILIKQKKTEEALRYLKKTAPAISQNTLSERSLRYHCLAICYVAMKQNKLAEYYFLKMLTSENYDKFLIGDSYESRFIDNLHVIQFYVSIRNYKQASKYINNALSIPSFNTSALNKSDFQLIQFKVDSARGNYISAIQHFQAHKKLQDSIFNAHESNQVADIQMKYETEAKDKNIIILTKQSQLQKAGLQQAALTRNVTFGGIIMLLLLLALSLNRYQLKLKNNLELTAQQTVINNKNQALEQLVDDKEWLLKEIHHRVKNNLQIVISLLNTQSVYIENTEALGAIRESQHRMQSISLIHQKLYQSESLAKIDMMEYINDLVEYLKDSFGIKSNVQLILEIEPISLDVVHAVPIGLILNEAITNAIKYAFPNYGYGVVHISLEEPFFNEYHLTIKDDGCGLPANFDFHNLNSLGMGLISGLTKQLSGKFTIENRDGVEIKTIFPGNSTIRA